MRCLDHRGAETLDRDPVAPTAVREGDQVFAVTDVDGRVLNGVAELTVATDGAGVFLEREDLPARHLDATDSELVALRVILVHR